MNCPFMKYGYIFFWSPDLSDCSCKKRIKMVIMQNVLTVHIVK
uniref:Uncharacterized protein n=1 Tax=Arundo donax TaxID=35708 RepID=A0A0A8ZZM2_ARUDO